MIFLTDIGGKQILSIDKDESVVTNEELITPSSFSSLKSCNEISAQEEVPDALVFDSDRSMSKNERMFPNPAKKG